MRKKPRFTHGRDNLRGDVSGKRFSTHAMERNVVRIGDGWCGNNKGMASAWGEDGKWVGVRCAIAQGGRCGVRTQGTTIIREREEPMVRWCRGMAHHCQAPHRHGTATPGVHMGIIVKFSVALTCVKSPVSRTVGTIYVVT